MKKIETLKDIYNSDEYKNELDKESVLLSHLINYLTNKSFELYEFFKNEYGDDFHSDIVSNLFTLEESDNEIIWDILPFLAKTTYESLVQLNSLVIPKYKINK